MKKTGLTLVAIGLACGMQTLQAGDITGKIMLKGTPPAEKPITPLKEDPNCGKLHTDTPTTHFYLVGSGGELGDVVVSVEGMSGKSTGASAPAAMLDQKGCEYVPYIMAVQTDQKITVKNSDPVAHNVHMIPAVAGNMEQNKMQVEKAPDLNFSFAKPEPFLRFKCDVHSWMFAYVSVFDHPYFAVSGKDGSYKISNVPAGKYKITAAHRKAGTVTQEIEVKDGENKADFSMDVK